MGIPVRGVLQQSIVLIIKDTISWEHEIVKKGGKLSKPPNMSIIANLHNFGLI